MIEDLPATRVLFKFFGDLARTFEDEFTDLREQLRAARMPTLYRSYVARTLLYSVISAALASALLVGGALLWIRTDRLLATPKPTLIGAFTFPGLAVGYLVYRLRLYYPRHVAGERGRAIDLGMAGVINFMLALARGRVPTGRALRQVAAYAPVLGPAADEMRYASRDIEYFRADVITALRRLARTTPSEEFAEFTENYANLLASRGDVVDYLDDQMRTFFREAELTQDEFLTTLGLLGEAYVALFVAGPLFGVILFIVMGFLGGDMIFALRFGVYVFIPLSAVAYLVLLDMVMENPLVGRGQHVPLEVESPEDRFVDDIPEADRAADERFAAEMRALERYEARLAIRRRLRAPIALMERRPRYALVLGVVIGLAYAGTMVLFGYVAPGAPITPEIGQGRGIWGLVRALDDTLVEATMISLAFFVAFFERRWRHLIRIERALPDFLNALSDRHQRGVSLSRGLESLSDVDLRTMNDELERMRRDIRLNTSANAALKRFANRIRSPHITRMIVLLTTATESSQRIGPVVETLATSAELRRRLDRKRQIEMMLYVVIIYLAFFVFVVVLAILNNVFLPQMPQQGIEGALGSVGGFNATDYQTVFYHASIVQGFFGGLVAGKMSEARVAAGAKHSLLMVLIAYLAFTAILPAIAVSL